MPILPPQFYNRPTSDVAKDLLGKFVVRKIGSETVCVMISEVEAYDGLDDKASHASRGMTPRNAVMFGPAGFWYVYLIYGMHWLVNIVTGPEDYPAAILIRGSREVEGPARLTKHLGIDKAFNEVKASKESGLWIEDRGIIVPRSQIKKAPRIGVDYAGEWALKEMRFLWQKD